MRNLKMILLMWLTVSSVPVFAAQTVVEQLPPTATAPPVTWTSNNVTNKITIENGNGANLNIVITVNDSDSEDPAGINVQNCGATTHIDAGSSAVCITNDAKNPVTFSSDKEHAATGSYQITQQLPQQEMYLK